MIDHVQVLNREMRIAAGLKRVLVPLDRSPLAEQAIERAIRIADASHAALDFVLVHKGYLRLDGGGAWAGERRYLDGIVAAVSARASVPVTHAVLTGETADAICRRIEEVGADLVVMTSHGRTGVSRAWLGSVADGVIRQSLVPVLVLRATESSSQHGEAPPRLLVLLDGSLHAADVLPIAVNVGAAIGARLSLLRVVEPAAAIAPTGDTRFDYVPPIIDHGATRQIADDATAQLANTARAVSDAMSADVEFEVVVSANVAQAILDFVRARGIDVIAMSTHSRGLSRMLVGSVTDKILRGSGLPMLVYRPLGPGTRDVDAQADDVVVRDLVR